MLSDGWTFFSQTPESLLWVLILRLDIFGRVLLLVMPVDVHPRDSCSLTAPPWYSVFGVPPASSPAVADTAMAPHLTDEEKDFERTQDWRGNNASADGYECSSPMAHLAPGHVFGGS